MRKARRIPPSRMKKLDVKETNAINTGFGYNMPPEDGVVHIYFNQKGYSPQANCFLKEFKGKNWKTSSGKKITNWKVLASDWLFNFKQEQKYARRTSKFGGRDL